MKKILSVILALAMIFALCAVCASADVETCQKGKLIMATNAAFPPYEFISDEDGETIVGVDAEIAGLIAEKLGLELVIEDIEFASIVSGVQQGKFDIGMAGMTVTEERLQNVDFSSTYAQGVQSVIVAEGSDIKSVDDLAGKMIGVQESTTGHIYCEDDFGVDNVTAYSTGASAVEALKQRTVLGKYAEENGIELTEEDLSEIDEAYAGLDETAKGYGYSDANAFLSTNYGLGVNKEVSKAMDLESALAQKAINAYSETVEISNAEIEERYPSVNIRHILVKAEADESGVYTDEAKEAAKAKAEEIYEEWKAGDATEESFAALAEKYSEDEGSNTNGGLYENVLQGQMVEEFDAFCFEDGRKAGDTGVVYGESAAYAGYHVMYFSGKGDPANNETGRQNLLSEKCAEWLEELASAVEVTYEDAYKFVGKN